MIKLNQDERIDWFRVFVELRQAGIKAREAARRLDIPHSTLQGYRSYEAEPRFKQGLKILQFWAAETNQELSDVPVYDYYKPHPDIDK